MKWKPDTKHTTYKEIDFLLGLGTHGRGEGGLARHIATPEEKLALLEGYKKSMNLRFSWTGTDLNIDPAQVAAVLEEEIAKLKAELNGKN